MQRNAVAMIRARDFQQISLYETWDCSQNYFQQPVYQLDEVTLFKTHWTDHVTEIVVVTIITEGLKLKRAADAVITDLYSLNDFFLLFLRDEENLFSIMYCNISIVSFRTGKKKSQSEITELTWKNTAQDEKD